MLKNQTDGPLIFAPKYSICYSAIVSDAFGERGLPNDKMRLTVRICSKRSISERPLKCLPPEETVKGFVTDSNTAYHSLCKAPTW